MTRNYLHEHLPDGADEEEIRAGFKRMNPKVLAALDDVPLSLLQSEYPRESPQFMFSEREWQRRLLQRQVKEHRLTAMMTSGIGLAGVVLGWFLKTLSE